MTARKTATAKPAKTAKKPAAAKKTAAPTKKTTPLDEHGLLAHTLQVIASLPDATWRGRLAVAQTQIEADVAGMASLLAFVKDTYSRAMLMKELAARAAIVERPDLALKVAKKISSLVRNFGGGAVLNEISLHV